MQTDNARTATPGVNGAVGPVVYAALGDSTGAGLGARKGGYVARLHHRIQRVQESARLINLCQSGATSEDVLRSQVSRAISARPTLVTICIGLNDVTSDVSVDRFSRNLNDILARLKSDSRAALVMSNVPDLSQAPLVPAMLRSEAHRRVNAYNERIAKVAAQQEVALVDMYHHSRELIPKHPEFFSADQFHPSDEGYEYWAFLMWPTLKEAMGIRE